MRDAEATVLTAVIAVCNRVTDPVAIIYPDTGNFLLACNELLRFFEEVKRTL
jgi:hypothetical protein